MEIVPVIDLKGGQVVHARGGARDSYTAIHSPLAEDSAPLTIVRGLRDLHHFTTLYVADLDAIEGRGDHGAELGTLSKEFPDIRLWVDNGMSSEDDCRAWLAGGGGELVLGSESQSDTRLLEALRDRVDAGRIILSLDFKGDNFLGPPALLEQIALWPTRIIAMTLARVGGQLGPDTNRLQWLRGLVPQNRIYAAGGVRDVEDLTQLAALGVSGALVASALHSGRISKSHLESFPAAPAT